MRGLRRVPWASRIELEELYDMTFSPAADVASKQRGLSRMSLYLASPSCPVFLPLLHGLVSSSLLPDVGSAEQSTTKRMSCAMAIVRFVNGMVDPLQTGGYARPISHLAATIGIPPILITIRHRATHDDLPPLPLLVTSVNMAIDYLHHYAFLPLLASSSDATIVDTVSPGRNRADGLVKRWKKAMKTRIRDKLVGDENESGREIKKVKRDLEMVDTEDLASALVTIGGIIPLAKRKRPGFSSRSPPQASLQLWAPLLDHLTSISPTLTSLLAEQLLSAILDPGSSLTSSLSLGLGVEAKEELQREEASARWTCATWLLWLWAREDELALKPEDKTDFSRRILGSLLQGDNVIRRLHRGLTNLDESLADSSALNDLLPTADDADDEAELGGLDEIMPEIDAIVDDSAKLDEMEERLRQLAANRSQRALPASDSLVPASPGDQLPTGWRGVESGWKECPIGIWAGA